MYVHFEEKKEKEKKLQGPVFRFGGMERYICMYYLNAGIGGRGQLNLVLQLCIPGRTSKVRGYRYHRATDIDRTKLSSNESCKSPLFPCRVHIVRHVQYSP